MRHHSNTRKFGREKTQRQALMRSLARNLIRDSRIKTTTAKAKELRPFVEKLVTRAKTDTLAGRRLINVRIQNESLTKKLLMLLHQSSRIEMGDIQGLSVSQIAIWMVVQCHL